MNLFIDTSNQYIIFILFKDKNIIAMEQIETNRNQSERFISEFDSFIKNNKIDIDTIENYYFSKGPGSFTGIRVGLTFAKALKLSNPGINVYTFNSLLLLLPNFTNSMAVIDARGKKYYALKVIDSKIKNTMLIDNDDLESETSTSIGTYDNTTLKSMADNLIYIVDNQLYENNLDTLYVKEAF